MSYSVDFLKHAMFEDELHNVLELYGAVEQNKEWLSATDYLKSRILELRKTIELETEDK